MPKKVAENDNRKSEVGKCQRKKKLNRSLNMFALNSFLENKQKVEGEMETGKVNWLRCVIKLV